jgi:1-acyl-sn-glycerol-3-phosphate acyltransferase
MNTPATPSQRRPLLWLRSALLMLYFIVYTLLYAIACMLCFPFLNAHRRYWFANGWSRTSLRVLEILNGIHYHVIGQENLPNDPAILIAKHQSAWETIALPVLVPKPLCYVLKRELLYIPFFGWTLNWLKMVYIDRSKGKDAFASMLEQGRARLAEGCWIVVFPEGTRIPVGRSGKYKTGGVRLARGANAPIVPIAHNAGRVWPRNAFIKVPGTVTVSFGPPIDPTGRSIEEINRQVETWIETEMRRIDPTAYADPSSTAT